MAKAVVNLICAKCGAEFERTKICYNRKDADSWETYMTDCADCLCSECYKEKKKAEREAEKQKFVDECYSKLNLPQIEGVSEKQVKYAEDLRIKFVQSCFCPTAKKAEIAKIIETEKSARKIIDTLKDEID